MTTSRNAALLLAEARGRLDPAMRTALVRLDPANRHVADYHLGHIEADGRAAEAGGKAVRGALALLSARVAGAPVDIGVPAAVAVELTHSYSLLHDDIIDGDETRRHRPAAWTVFGRDAAILAGDAMAALAAETLAEAPGPPVSVVRALDMLASATRRMIAGQSADIAFEGVDGVSLAECQQMVGNKTGALLSCAASLGAVLAGADPGVVMSLEGYGRHVGMAFQLVDDLLGIWGAPETTGKPAASDLASRKKSLPVVAALESGGPDADRLRALYATDDDLSVPELAAAAAAVEGAGGRAWAQAEADRETAAALTVLDELPVDGAVRAELRSLTEMLCRRDR